MITEITAENFPNLTIWQKKKKKGKYNRLSPLKFSALCMTFEVKSIMCDVLLNVEKIFNMIRL